MLLRRTLIRRRQACQAGRPTSRTLASVPNGGGDLWNSFLDWFTDSSTSPHHRHHQTRKRCVTSYSRSAAHKDTSIHWQWPEQKGDARYAPARQASTVALFPNQFNRKGTLLPSPPSSDRNARNLSFVSRPENDLRRRKLGYIGRSTNIMHFLQPSELPSCNRTFHASWQQFLPAEDAQLAADAARESSPSHFLDGKLEGTVRELRSLLAILDEELERDNMLHDNYHLYERIWVSFQKLKDNTPEDVSQLSQREFRHLFTVTKKYRIPWSRKVERVRQIQRHCKEATNRVVLLGYEALFLAYKNSPTAMDRVLRLLEKELLELNITPRLATYEAILKVCIKDWGLDRALLWLDELERQDVLIQQQSGSHTPFRRATSTYNILLHGCVLNGDMKRAEELVNDVKALGLKLDVYSWTILIDGYGRQGERDQMMELFAKMTEADVKPTRVTYETIIYALLEGKRLARQTRRVMGDKNMGRKAVQAPMDASDDEALSEALAVYDAMTADGFPPGVLLCNMFMTAYVRRRQFDKAKSMFEGLRESDLYPDVISYGIYMLAHVHEGNIAAVDQIYEEMKAKYIMPDLKLYGTIIFAHSRVGNLASVEKYLKNMLEDGWQSNEKIWNMIIYAHCQSGDMKGAMALAQQMANENFPPSIVTFRTLLHGFGSANQIEGVEKIWNLISDTSVDISVDTYNTAIAAFARCNNRTRAIDLYVAMIDRGVHPDLVTFNTLLTMEAAHRNSHGVSERFREMSAAGMPGDERTFLPMIHLHAAKGDITRAKDVISHMETLPNVNPTIRSHNAIIELLCKSGRIGEAEDEYTEATEEGRIKADVATYDMLVRAHAVIADVSGAQHWFDVAIKSGIKPDTRLYNALISAYMQAKDHEGASAVINKMREQNIPPDVMTSMYMLAAKSIEPGSEEAVVRPRQPSTRGRLRPDQFSSGKAATPVV